MASLEITIDERVESDKKHTTLGDLESGELLWLDDDDGVCDRSTLFTKAWGDNRRSGAFTVIDLHDGQLLQWPKSTRVHRLRADAELTVPGDA